jgi:uncharacterized membrane protein YdcZ (DUF606 family)
MAWWLTIPETYTLRIYSSEDTAPLNWALIGGIIGAVVVIVSLLAYFLAIRKKRE